MLKNIWVRSKMLDSYKTVLKENIMYCVKNIKSIIIILLILIRLQSSKNIRYL